MKNQSKKPTYKEFKDVSKRFGGNISAIANEFKVARKTIYAWAKEDENFKDIIEDYRGYVLDECFFTSRILARGIPIKDENGNFVEWKEKPDGNMLRYLMSTLGRKEGFGEKMDITTNGENISSNVVVEIIDKREDVENTDN